MRTQESVILDDAAKPNLFSEDPYFGLRRQRSILCLPLIRQGTLVGLLYLENALASHVFTPERARLLELLAAQAAISLENTRLYGDLREREAKIRRLVDSNIIGICIIDLDGRDHRGQRRVSRHRGIRARGCRLGSPALDRPDAAGMARSRRAGSGGDEIDRNLPAIREGVFPERRQPRAGAGGVARL